MEVLVADLRKAEPRGALCGPARGGWSAVPYEAEGISGHILVTVNGQGAPPVRIRLPASGLYEIRLGTYYGHTAWVQAALAVSSGGRTFTRVRLSGDEHWDTVEAEHYGPREGEHLEKQVKLNEMLEVRWRVARLEGSELEIAPVDRKFAEGTLASLAYVRLVPLDEVQYRTEMPRPDTKRLVAVFDGTFYGNFPRDEEEIWGYFEPMRGSDFSLVFWATCRLDACYYLSEVGRPLTPLPEGMLNRRTYILRDFQRWVEKGKDPLEVAVDAAHELGLEIYGSMRLTGLEIPPFHQFHGAPTFMTEHPELWTVDASGHRVPHLSLAFPEVRNFIVRLFREQAERYGIDGVHVLFNRSFPFVLFEEPFVRDFVKRYGEDPRNLDPSDPRLWEQRSEYTTALLRELRATLDDVVRRKGRRLGIAVHAMNSLRNNLYFGLDVVRWAKEGLVDHLVLHPCPSVEAVENGAVTPDALVEVTDALRGTGVRVYADLYPRRNPPEKIARKVLEYYRAGVDGISFWDTYARMWRKSEWSAIRLCGHREELERWEGKARSFWRKVRVDSIDGISLDPRYGVQTHG